jgi:DNA ligase-1
MLKVKAFHDDEAEIIDYENGTGKYKNVMGSLIVKNNRGAVFKVGSGFSDEQRKERVIIGRKITFRYAEINKTGAPRFPVFLRYFEDI